MWADRAGMATGIVGILLMLLLVAILVYPSMLEPTLFADKLRLDFPGNYGVA